MRLVQFETREGRRLGLVDGRDVVDLSAVRPAVARVVDAFTAAEAEGCSLAELAAALGQRSTVRHSYDALLENTDLAKGPVLRPPVDHADPHRVLVSGTGLTHLGSAQSRDAMHAPAASAEPMTDSKRMFQWGLEGGRPPQNTRGTAPEWFYKGNGTVLRGGGETLEVPPFAEDGGEEPELVGCYIIDAQGTPRRLGFALGNEWSDHSTESHNYLYLAPSKLRECAVGPELVTDFDFQHLELRCTVERDGQTVYDSGVLHSGERNMCHSLANCEDHHFKYAQHRVPGDVHLHFFGTSKLSFRSRDWQYADGDLVRVAAEGFSQPLVNRVRRPRPSATPTTVRPA